MQFRIGLATAIATGRQEALVTGLQEQLAELDADALVGSECAGYGQDARVSADRHLGNVTATFASSTSFSAD